MTETIEMTPLSITLLSALYTLIGVLVGYGWGLLDEFQREIQEWEENEE